MYFAKPPVTQISTFPKTRHYCLDFRSWCSRRTWDSRSQGNWFEFQSGAQLLHIYSAQYHKPITLRYVLLCSYLHFLSFSVIEPSLHHFCRVFHNLSLSLLYISFHHIYLFFISPISLHFFVSYLSYPHYPALLFLFARFLYLFQPGEIYLRLLENRVGMWFPIHQGWCG